MRWPWSRKPVAEKPMSHNKHACKECRGHFWCGDPTDLDWDGVSCSGRNHPMKCGDCGRWEWKAHNRERDEYIRANGAGWRYRSSEFYALPLPTETTKDR